MAKSRREDQWEHTADLLCLLANINRNPQRRPHPFKPEQFNRAAGSKQRIEVKLGPKESVAFIASTLGLKMTG